MAFYVYNIQNCTTGGQIQAYTDALGSSNLTPGQTVVKIGSVCYSVTSYVGFQQNIPIGAIDMTQFTDSSLLWSDCSSCTNPQIQPTGGGPTGGGGGGGGTQAYFYDLKECSQLSNPNAQIVKARRITGFADLQAGNSIKYNNTCFTVVQWVPNPPIPTQYSVVITTSPKYDNCAQCTTPPPTVWRIQYTLQRCDNPNLTIQAFRIPLSTETPGSPFSISTGQIYKVNNICYTVITASWEQGQPDLSQANVTNLSTFITCQACNPQQQPIGTNGTTGEALVQGWICQGGTCTSIFYNPADGTEAFSSLPECLNSGCQGYNCTPAGCIPATEGQGTYSTQAQCASNCQGVNGGGGPVGSSNERIYIYSLRNCANPSDIIQGWKDTIESPGSIYRFYQSSLTWKCYTAYAVVEAFGEEIPNPRGVDLRSKPKFVSCTNCLPDEMPLTGSGGGGGGGVVDDGSGDDSGLTFCEENPDHPSCDPCFLNPCSPGCPLECDKCPDDPRCNIINCDEVPEPVQGELLYSFVKTSFSGNPPTAVSQKFRIHECWQWKYCVCRSQPDPINLPNVYYYTVCLCNPEIGNPCPAAGTFIRYECRNSSDPNNPIKREKWAVYENGNCGTYDQLIEENSTFCGAVPDPTCTPSGTLLRTYCVGTDKYGEYADGKCGKYIERIEINSKQCGYVDPPPPLPDDPVKDIEPPVSAQVYYPINKENTLKSVDITSFALWSGDTSFLLSPSTESLADSSSLNYIFHVYDRSPDTSPTCSAELQYNIIYADYEGKGATDLGGYDNQTLTKAMYTQYAHVLLPHGQTKFNFNGEDEDYVYIIDIARKRFKQSLDPGNWEITLASASFSFDNETNSILSDMYTASYNDSTITFVDALTKRPEIEAPVYLSSKSYDVFVGSIEEGIGTNYLSSSIASQSISTGTATHIIESNSDAVTSNTVIVQGAKAFYWGPGDAEKNANYAGPTLYVTCSYRLIKQDEFIVNDSDKIVNYVGSFTGSFTAPTTEATFTPTLISGSAIGHWDSRIGKMAISTGVSSPDRTLQTPYVKLTYNFIDYNGNIKFEPVSEFTGPSEWTTAFISASYNQSIVTGSYTGSAVGIFYADSWAETTFIDSAWDEDDFTDPTYTGSGTFPGLDSGSTSGFVLFPVNKNSYGRVYPSHGIIVLSGKKLDQLGLNTNRSIDKNGYNTYRLYHSMKLVLDLGLTDLSGDKLAFYARGVDIKRSSRYFITLKNSQLNYSNNPTFVTGSEGDIRNEFILQNKAFFSSIGLYNADKELLAIGKVSKPIMSTLTDEMLFTVKIAQ